MLDVEQEDLNRNYYSLVIIVVNDVLMIEKSNLISMILYLNFHPNRYVHLHQQILPEHNNLVEIFLYRKRHSPLLFESIIFQPYEMMFEVIHQHGIIVEIFSYNNKFVTEVEENKIQSIQSSYELYNVDDFVSYLQMYKSADNDDVRIEDLLKHGEKLNLVRHLEWKLTRQSMLCIPHVFFHVKISNVMDKQFR